jgi:hypothetical protein
MGMNLDPYNSHHLHSSLDKVQLLVVHMLELLLGQKACQRKMVLLVEEEQHI